MSRDYPRLHDFYIQFHELQLPHQYQHEYELATSPHTSSAPPYELTVGSGAGAGSAGVGLPAPALSVPASLLPLNHQPDNEVPHYATGASSDTYDDTSGCESTSSTLPHVSMHSSTDRKRKSTSYGTASMYDDDDDNEDVKSKRSLPDKKQNHSEIEKRRRDKMNTYITELSSIVPMCCAMGRKLDKLTVLRMAVQHMRGIRGAQSAGPLAPRPRPAYLSERGLNRLIVQAAHDAIVVVVGCDRGRVLYVSASVQKMLHYEQSELLGQSLFDILHPKDVAKVKEQLSSSDLNPRERLIDAKTMLPVKGDMVSGASRLCPGARRSFFCCIKCKPNASQPQSQTQPIKEEHEKIRKKHEKKYCVVQFTGYLKSWAPLELAEGGGGCGEEESSGTSCCCLVAVGRALQDLAPAPPLAKPPHTKPPPTRPPQYMSRHATDGKFLFVDQRVTLALGFLPQELLGSSLYEYVAPGALASVAREHRAALMTREQTCTAPYCFRRKDGTEALIRTQFKPFRNPWTKDVEYLVANNTVVLESEASAHVDSAHNNFESDASVQQLISSQVECHKIGSAIAEEVLRRSSPDYPPDLPLPIDLLHDTFLYNPRPSSAQVLESLEGASSSECSYSCVRNNVSLSAASAASPPTAAPGDEAVGAVGREGGPPDGGGGGDAGDEPPPAGSPPPLSLDVNSEAAMAVIMSLLEADAGLGGPVNISGLPWPLP